MNNIPCKNVIEQIQETAKAFPQKKCIVGNDGSISYSELVMKANHLASQIVDFIGNNHRRIIVICEKPIQVIISMLGVMKSGNVYLPVTEDMPIDRIKQIVAECDVVAYISRLSKNELEIAHIPYVEKDDVVIYENIDYSSFNELAYIIFTSGTTGKSKGVGIKHIGLANTIFSRNKILHIDQECRIALLMGYSFDGFFTNVFSPLAAGGVIVYADNFWDTQGVINTISKYNVNTLLCTPTRIKSIIKEDVSFVLNGIGLISLAGEIVSESLVISIKNKYPRIQLANEYGPTENSICSSINPDLEKGSKVTVGRPIDNVEFRILHHNNDEGELLLSGIGLADGYINDPNASCFQDFGGKTWYNTGDLAYWYNNEIVILGRTNSQIKVHGYRVDLEEIHKAINECSLVEDCVVVHNEFDAIIVYYVSLAHISNSTFFAYLHTKLNEYMIPKAYHRVKCIPMQDSGKVDYSSLKEYIIDEVDANKTSYDKNGLETAENKILTVFKACLEVDDIASDDNFFECGGDSLASVKLVALLNENGYMINEKTLIQYPTPHQLATFLCFGQIASEDKTYYIEPFNDFWFIDCYFTSVLASLKSQNQPLVPFMRSFFISEVEYEGEFRLLYECNYSYKTVFNYYSLNYKKYRIRSETDFRKTVIDMVNKHIPAFIHVDCFYLPYFINEFSNKHVEHVLLIVDYDPVCDRFVVIDQTNLDSISFCYRNVGACPLIKAMLSVFLDHNSFDEADCVCLLPIEGSLVEQTNKLKYADNQIRFVIEKAIEYSNKNPEKIMIVFERIMNYFTIEKYVSDSMNDVALSDLLDKALKKMMRIIMQSLRGSVDFQNMFDYLHFLQSTFEKTV